MKQSELKKILKPLIKQCIKEVIFEDGVLSGLISEVVQGIGTPAMMVETRRPEEQPAPRDFSEQQSGPDPEFIKTLEENKRKLEESLGSRFKGVLTETAPLSSGGDPSSASKVQSPLATYAPNDAGVDISGIMAIGGGQNWKKMI